MSELVSTATHSYLLNRLYLPYSLNPDVAAIAVNLSGFRITVETHLW